MRFSTGTGDNNSELISGARNKDFETFCGVTLEVMKRDRRPQQRSDADNFLQPMFSSSSQSKSAENEDDNSQADEAIENIPEHLRVLYAPLVAGLAFLTRVNLYKILQSLLWTEEYCAIILDVLKYTHSCEVIEPFVTFGESLHVSRRPVYFYVVRALQQPHLSEFLERTPYEIIFEIIELANCSPLDEVNTMIHLIHDYTVVGFFRLVKHSDEPFAKHCRLCRVRKIYTLEYRLGKSQITEVILDSFRVRYDMLVVGSLHAARYTSTIRKSRNLVC
jgi:hypothetical protein